MKTRYTFYFEGEPQFAGTDPREYTAHLLRAWRNGAQGVTLKRLGFGHYRVEALSGNVAGIVKRAEV
jgi:hypothetical protein